jgi:cation diffusion facilitator family transporter
MTAGHSQHESPVVIYGALLANLGIAIAKFVAAAMTGSSAMISEGIHSLVDTGNELLLLWGLRRSRTPADTDHPFGHGQELYFWSLIVAVLLFGVGGGMSIYEGITHVIDPSPLEDPFIAYVVLAIALLLEGASWVIAARAVAAGVGEDGVIAAIRSSKDPSVITVLLEDSAALAGLVAAAVGIYLSHQLEAPWIDGVASIVIGIILAAVAVFLVAEARGLLIGERADDTVIERLHRVAEADARVEQVVEVRTMHMGPSHVLVTMRVRFTDVDAAELIDVIDALEMQLRELDSRLDDVTIQPVGPPSERRTEP